MKVLLTGATGFVGAEVMGRLLEAGHEVRALKRPWGAAVLAVSFRKEGSLAPVEWYVGDLADPGSLRAAVAGVEAVVHVAAEVSYRRDRAAELRRVNVEGTRELGRAAAAAGVRRFVHTSSVTAIGYRAGGTADEAQPYNWPPGLGYHESKRDAEAAVRAEAGGMEVVIVNPAMVFGPGEEPRGRTLALLKATRRGVPPLLPPGGITACDVRDVAAAHVAALTRGRPGERYILGGAHLSFTRLRELVAEALGIRRPMLVLPQAVLQLASVAAGLVDHLVTLPLPPALFAPLGVNAFYASDKAVAELGYAPRPVEETMRDTVDWYRGRGLV